jgi:hypothetical protein
MIFKKGYCRFDAKLRKIVSVSFLLIYYIYIDEALLPALVALYTNYK